MSIATFSASLSGLNANQQKLNVIGNNLANLNTVAFKSSAVNFADLVSQSVGGSSANPMQIGLGVSVGQITPNFSQGSIESTGVGSNVAIQGGGFFVVGDAQNRSYTRAGDFGFDANGVLQTADGRPVQGYTTLDPVTGLFNTSVPPTDIVVNPGVLRAPVPTTEFGAIINLDAGAATAATFASSVPIVDALGVSHVATITFTKTGPGAWGYSMTVPGAEVSGGTAGTPFPIGTGTLGFNDEGRLSLVNAATAADVTVTSPTWANGAAPTDFTWDSMNASGQPTISGYASPSATASVTQNGVTSGSPSSLVVIDQDGYLMASYGIGQTMRVGQLALANFNNPEGLVKLGTNLWSASETSGVAVIGTPGTGSRGTIIGSALEQSNVDIAHEFTQMILAQRGYQASSKGITVADELLVDTLNLKR